MLSCLPALLLPLLLKQLGHNAGRHRVPTPPCREEQALVEHGRVDEVELGPSAAEEGRHDGIHDGVDETTTERRRRRKA